jgi:hypothetical protein
MRISQKSTNGRRISGFDLMYAQSQTRKNFRANFFGTPERENSFVTYPITPRLEKSTLRRNKNFVSSCEQSGCVVVLPITANSELHDSQRSRFLDRCTEYHESVRLVLVYVRYDDGYPNKSSDIDITSRLTSHPEQVGKAAS